MKQIAMHAGMASPMDALIIQLRVEERFLDEERTILRCLDEDSIKSRQIN
jgi:hypothetical protein